jgi:hypothetical protein
MWELASLLPINIDPAMSVFRLWQSVTGEAIVDVLVFARQKKVIAVFTFGHVNDQVPFSH